MKTKIINGFWLILLMGTNFFVGFATLMQYDRMALCSERISIFIMGGIIMNIAIGGMSLILKRMLRKNVGDINSIISRELMKKVEGSRLFFHRILKKVETETPTKIALLFYTVFTLIFFCFSLWGFRQAMFEKCGFWL